MIAAIYARKSTDQNGVTDEQKSVTRQVDHARDYAGRKGWTVVDECIYVDDGISGAEFARRPGFLRMMAGLKPRTFDVLIMSEESRLGREAIETAYALKQIISAGVRIFYYMEDRERSLETATDKLLMSVTAFADELEREKARLRVTDAMQRHARMGHVNGGRLFGYRNVEVLGPDGKRSHVQRQINEDEAVIVRRVFALAGEGHGQKAIAKILNSEHAISPRTRPGRSQTWAPSSVRCVLHQPSYRGVMVWNRTKKRDQWGQYHQKRRAVNEWIEVPAPHLRIISDADWEAAHAQLTASREVYFRTTNGRAFGRPVIGTPSKYLLTNLTACGKCGATMKVLLRGRERARFYACAFNHDRGASVCANNVLVPMEDANEVVLAAVLDDVLDADMIRDAVDVALETIVGNGRDDARRGTLDLLEKNVQRLEKERQRLVDAVAAGGELMGLLDALKAREAELTRLRTERERLQTRPATIDARVVREELLALATDWRGVLLSEPLHARSVLTKLLASRVIFTPLLDRQWQIQGTGTIAGLFSRLIAPNVALGMVPVRGFEPRSRG